MKVKDFIKDFSLPCTLIFLALLSLKLSNIIDCSWRLVTSPIWVPCLLCAVEMTARWMEKRYKNDIEKDKK